MKNSTASNDRSGRDMLRGGGKDRTPRPRTLNVGVSEEKPDGLSRPAVIRLRHSVSVEMGAGGVQMNLGQYVM